MIRLTADGKRLIVDRFRALYAAIHSSAPDLAVRFAAFQLVYQGGEPDFVAAFQNTKSAEDRMRWVWLLRRHLANDIEPAFFGESETGSYRLAD